MCFPLGCLLFPLCQSAFRRRSGEMRTGQGRTQRLERVSVFCVCLPCKLFSCAVDLRGEWRDGRTDGQERGREWWMSRVARRQAAVLLFDGESSLRQAGIYFKCQDET